MAGRQAHRKFDVRNDTSTRWKGKLYGIFVNYMGEDYAKEFVEQAYSNYEKVFVNIYTKIHNQLRTTLTSSAGAGATFPLWQIINEAIYAVYLTHKETASFLYAKYVARGIQPNVVKKIIAEVGNALKGIVPAVAQELGETVLDESNVISVVDGIVRKNPALPNSYAGIILQEARISTTPHYEGTEGFSSMESAYSALEEIEKGL
ncbi:virion structural protein [Betalipothrixvirus puteoliense]|uniref:Structural protein n=1 Tax=Betalipothrixvirus puteoliense TaxID=346884 RepID=A7WKW1_9VIRU|nr:virion structural protein [Acidianus filamentous virus 8]CAJ31708.1 structural protein [Acidianus filamentous virus 8]